MTAWCFNREQLDRALADFHQSVCPGIKRKDFIEGKFWPSILTLDDLENHIHDFLASPEARKLRMEIGGQPAEDDGGPSDGEPGGAAPAARIETGPLADDFGPIAGDIAETCVPRFIRVV